MEKGKKVKRIPTAENGRGVVYTARSGNAYKITKHISRPLFFLWKVVDGGYEKLCEMESPYDLYVVIDQLEGL